MSLRTRFSFITIALSGLLSLLAPTSLLAERATRVDLSGQQTPLKNQGNRFSCITFGALAALEAAYKRAGYGDLDLSEQFLNHLGKTFWLHYPWSEVMARGEDGWEGQVGAFSGGGGPGYLEMLTRGMRVPLETVMPYRSTEYSSVDHPHLIHAWNDPWWNQRRRSDFNLDSRFLPSAALRAARYYSGRGYRDVNPNDAAAIEAVLASGKEVVWDFSVANTSDPIWRPCRPKQMGCPSGGHSMVLIGYDRSDPDPANHYFLAKNSWAPTTNPGGFVRISYDYLRYGYAAGYIEGIESPQAWHELAFIGRWDLNFDGFKGTLDIYHVPGIMRSIFENAGVTTTDRRIGTFYDSTGRAFKVNGSISGQTIEFYIDGANPNVAWDRLGGRKFQYTLIGPDRALMAGMHTDSDGRVWGGYARKGGLLPAGTATPRPLVPRSYLGTWRAQFGDTTEFMGDLTLLREDNGFLTAAERPAFAGLTGSFTTGGRSHIAQVLVSRSNPREILMRIPSLLGDRSRVLESYLGQATARHLSHEPGVVAGTVFFTDTRNSGFVLVRR